MCYLAGLMRLMSALLVSFGALASLFFGILFMVTPEQRQLWLPAYVHGAASWPFFLLFVVLMSMVALFFIKKSEPVEDEIISLLHFKFFIGAFFGYLLSIFLPALLWFPSEVKRINLDGSTLGVYMLLGTIFYLLGITISLYLFYRASRGTTARYPDLMRRIVLAVFAIVHFDKIPVFIAFLLVYSSETEIIYPSIAALALAAYIPIALFLLKLSRQSEQI